MIRYVFTRTARYPGYEVEHYQFLRSLRILFVSFKYRGVVRTMLSLLAKVFLKLGLPFLQSYLFLNQAREQAGLDFGGIVETENLDIPEEFQETAVRYEATSEYEFRDVLESLHLDYQEYSFIDYGSGKGDILAAAARYPFPSIIGIELSQALHDVAVWNIAKMKQQNTVVSESISSVQGNAAEYHLPAVPHVIFIFNPFGADVLQGVLDRITTDLAEVREPVYFLYNNPMHHIVLDRSVEFQKISEPFGGKWMVFVRKPKN